MNTAGSAFARLLQEDIEGEKLKYAPRYGVNEWQGRRHELDVDYETEISRQDALAWADAKNFPIDHFR
jgi:hypothetical protein